jgi:hypothetical protein
MELTALATTTPGTGVATFLATPSSANLAAAVTDKIGSGSLVFGTSPTLTTPNIGVASGDKLTLTRTSTPSTREEIFRATVSDATTDFFGIGSGTLIDGRFAPCFFGMMNTFNGLWSMGFQGFVSSANDASDSSNSGVIDFAALRSSSTTDPINGTLSDVVNRRLFTWRTATTTHMTMSAAGNVGIGTGLTLPNSKAVLELASTTKGFLPPRMTTAQRDAITSVPAGLMIYNTSTNKLNFYNGSAWEAVTSA